MAFGFDYTRKDGTEVLVNYRVISWGGCEYWGGDPFEIELGDVYGLPAGETLTDEEWETVEQAIYANPPEPDSEY